MSGDFQVAPDPATPVAIRDGVPYLTNAQASKPMMPQAAVEPTNNLLSMG